MHQRRQIRLAGRGVFVGTFAAIDSASAGVPALAATSAPFSCTSAYTLCAGTGQHQIGVPSAPGPNATPAQLLLLQSVRDTPGVAAAGLVDGRCCTVVAYPGTSPKLPAAVVAASSPPVAPNTCRYTQTSYANGQYAGNGAYAVDSSLGAEQSSSAFATFGSADSSAKAEAGVQIYFYPNPLSWNGWYAQVYYPWHIQGTLSADTFGFAGPANASVQLNLVHKDNVTSTAVNAMSDNQSEGNSKSVSRNYADNVTNPTTMSFPLQDYVTFAAYIQSTSQTHAQAGFGYAEADADFASGNIQTRQGPQAWLDYEDWTYIPPPGSGDYIASC